MNKPNFLFNWDRQLKESAGKDSLQILALFFFTALVIYKLPAVMGHFLFIVFFILFYKSKKDYFWLAFFFAICTGPGHFFSISEEVSIGRLPFFGIGGGINISSTEIFLVIAIIKALTRGRKQQIPLSKPLIMIMVYSLFLFMVSFFVFGTELIRFLKDLRFFFYYFSIIPLSYLVYRQGEGEKLIYCIFPFVFVSFFSALYYILVGDYFINLLAPGVIEQIFLEIGEGGIRYTRYGTSGKGEHLMLLLCYLASLFLTFKVIRLKRKNRYLLLVAGISYVTILLTATRSWFVVFSFIFIAAVIFLQKNLKIVGGVLVIAVLFYIPYLFVPKIQDFANRSWTRLESVFEITQPGSIAYEMLEYKKKYRLIKTLEGIEESPLIGLGVSSKFYEYTRGGDIGNFNLILQVGIIGFLLFVYFWIRFFTMMKTINRKLSHNNPYNRILYFFSIVLVGLLIAHFTTHQVFFMVTSQSNSIFIMLFIFFTGYFARDALRLEYSLKNSANKAKKQGLR